MFPGIPMKGKHKHSDCRLKIRRVALSERRRACGTVGPISLPMLLYVDLSVYASA